MAGPWTVIVKALQNPANGSVVFVALARTSGPCLSEMGEALGTQRLAGLLLDLV